MTTEKFDMVVKFNNTLKNEIQPEDDDELVGIEEIKSALRASDPELYIKESEFFDVVMVELGTDSVEAATKLRNSNPKTISRIIPINVVVKSDSDEIVKCLTELAYEKMNPGDDFEMEIFTSDGEDEESKILNNRVVMELKKLDLNNVEKNSKWKFYVEIIGENAGLSLLKTTEV
jgi:tRNA(Ser,Leu) C12 N-acetylase TAN1